MQSQAYRDEVVAAGNLRRLSVEAGTTFGWSRYAQYDHGLDHYGASAPGKVLAEKFGFTPAALTRHFLEFPVDRGVAKLVGGECVASVNGHALAAYRRQRTWHRCGMLRPPKPG